MPKFSITIPAYKGQYLAEAIESILAQTCSDFELIIVDDCSPENLKNIVDKYNDPRIKYYRNAKNCGAENVVDNWNICLNHCTGEYVICMGDDDKLTSDCLDLYNRAIEKYPQNNVFHIQTLIINEKSDIVDIQDGRPEWESELSSIFNKFKGRLQFIGDWLFKVESLKMVGGYIKFPYAWYSDDLTPYVVSQGKGIVNINKFGFQYRSSNHTITSNNNNTEGKIAACNMAFTWLNDYINSSNNHSYDYIYRRIIIDRLQIIRWQEIRREIIAEIKNKGVVSFVSWFFKCSEYQIPHKKILKWCISAYIMP